MVPIYERLIDISEKAGDADYRVAGHIGLARHSIRRGEFDEAPRRVVSALAVAKEDAELHDSEVDARNLLGIVEVRRGNYEAAVSAWRENLAKAVGRATA